MQNNLILRFEASRTQLVSVGEQLRGEAIERQLRLLESLESLLQQLQRRIRAEKKRLTRLEKTRPQVLPIEGYDALNAKQVLASLDGLSHVERDQVLAYERANKNRKTVLRALERAAAA